MASLAILATWIVVASTPIAAQAPQRAASAPTGNYTPAKTPWGDPDLQGSWGLESVMMERDPKYGGRAFKTEEEWAEEDRKANNAEFEAKKARGEVENRGFRAQPNYNSIFAYTPGARTTVPRRTAAIIDPPDGRIPAWTPQQIKRYEAREAFVSKRGEADAPEDRALNERCIGVVEAARIPKWGLGGLTATDKEAEEADGVEFVMVNGSLVARGESPRILQAPGYIVFVSGDAHHRIVPLDRRPALGSTIRQYKGDARGHWEGNTLVVVTRNINDQQTNAGPGLPTYEQYLYPGPGDTLTLTERYKPISANEIEYTRTIDDPETYVRPWTVMLHMRKRAERLPLNNPEQCRETSKALTNILAGARADEKASRDSAEESAVHRRQRLQELKAEWAQKDRR
jgi:hypothetical protein